MRVLNVAEKNDAAKCISALLSNGQSRRTETHSPYNKMYSFQYRVMGQMANMRFTSVSGHLLNYAFTPQFRGWHSCSPLELFSAGVEKKCSEDYISILTTLQEEASRADTLIIWTDCDREGENIGFEVVDVVREVRPDIRVLRAKFSEITQSAVTRAMNNLIEPDEKMSQAVDVRSELDLRIGAAFTRLQTLRLQKRFPQLNEGVISYGSCQFPTLGFVVERWRARESFVSERFWRIVVTHAAEDITAEFDWARGRVFDERVATAFLALVQEEPLARVTRVEAKPSRKWRPVALDTVELEKLASRKLRMVAREVLKVAEKLYTRGIISYPRTETNQFPADFHLNELVERQQQHPQWGGFASRIIGEWGGATPRNGKKTDNAHPPIHPLKMETSLSGEEAAVYELITRHFLACCSKDAEGRETTTHIAVSGEHFSARGLQILARNYLDVYKYESWNTKLLPVYNEGEEFQPTGIRSVDGETTAPQLLSEADLITLMDKHGIGTDATHAEHIETIKKRGYAALQDNRCLVPLDLGIGLVEGYDAMGLAMSKPNLRAALEADLAGICAGAADPSAVLQYQISEYRKLFEKTLTQLLKLEQSVAKFFQPQQSDEQQYPAVCKCPSCGSQQTLRQSGRQFYLSCDMSPACNTQLWLPSSVSMVTVTPQICQAVTCQDKDSHLLALRITGNSALGLPSQLTTCLGCDRNTTEALELQFTTRSNNARDFRLAGRISGPGATNGFTSRERPRAAAAIHRQPADTTRQRPAPAPSRQRVPPQAGRQRGPSTSSPTPSCTCPGDLPAVRKTAGPQARNAGREFFTCASRECSFFAWCDENHPPSGRGPPPSNVPLHLGTTSTSLAGRSAGVKRLATGGTAGVERPPRRPSKCGICSEMGHTRKNCPAKALLT